MRPKNSASAIYQPEPVPQDPAQLARYLTAELQRISNAVALIAAGHMDMQYKAPLKPRNGNLRLADGTSWNPGSGKGVYWFDAATSLWVKL